jgi:Protein of unknown function (DUF3618)
MPTRSPQEIRGSIERTRGELAQSVEDLRTKMRVMTDWRRQIEEHRTAAIAAGAVAGFLIGRKLLKRRRT